jgi:hypothetical protein
VLHRPEGGGGAGGHPDPIHRRIASPSRLGSSRIRPARSDVIAPLDHAEIEEGPGGPASVVPGQHHVRMNMYIAQARSSRFEIVEELEAIDPQEPQVPMPAIAG